MQAEATRNLKPITLELGGKSPLIIFDDADVDMATDLALKGYLFNKACNAIFCDVKVILVALSRNCINKYFSQCCSY
ncbi:Aldehyde dehydrogenase family 2 member C4 [Bienertia sinuspersici]